MSVNKQNSDSKPSIDISKAHRFRKGDIVEFTNDYGLIFGPYKITDIIKKPAFRPECTIYLNDDSPWCPVSPNSLRKIPNSNQKPGFLRLNNN